MSNVHNTCFVAQIVLGDGTTYYTCSSTRINGFSMDGNLYYPYIMAVGDSEKIGNFGEGSSFGKGSMTILFGQEQYGGAYNLDISKPWNNGVCTIKIRDVDSVTTWAGCEDYYKGIIKSFKINADNLTFDIDDTNTKDNQILPRYTVEDIVEDITTLSVSTDIPEDSKGKRIPMQYGDLTSTSSGHFAKGILVSDKIGFQQVHFDSEELYQLTLSATSGLGIWDNKIKRLFIGKYDGEYKATSNKIIEFTVDSTTTLYPGYTTSASEGQEQIQVADGTKLTYTVDDSDDYYTNRPDILGTNIIAIDNELMLLLDQPDTSSTPNTVWVERGYNSTTPIEHGSSAKIYQSAKYSAKNLLSFTELFKAKAVSNPHFKVTAGTVSYQTPATYISTEPSGQGKLSKIADGSSSTYVNLLQSTVNGDASCQYNIDLKFDNIEEDFQIINIYAAIKIYAIITGSQYKTTLDNALLQIFFFDPYQDISYNQAFDSVNNSTYFLLMQKFEGEPTEYFIDTISAIQRDVVETYSDFYVPTLKRNNYGHSIDSISSLKDLNKKWKLGFYYRAVQYASPMTLDVNYNAKIYEIGLWIDFFIDFTSKRLGAPTKGRKVTAAVDTILGTARVGSYIAFPYEMIAHILTTEMGYATSDFDTASWQAVAAYWNARDEQPSCAMSWGIDDKEKGWDLCQQIASQHCLMLTKTDSGKIKLVNLYQLQSTAATGYSALTAYGISIDDIIISGGKRLLSIQQTGNDRIRNSVRINYNRNNSTDEYQGSFPGGEQGYTSDYLDTNETMPESGITLSQARTTYYGGKKTEDFVVDAFTIYAWSDAYRLWQWHIRDKAEVFFYAELTLPYYHYSNVNSKSSQYDIGDVIYFNGLHQGLTFNINHKWVIRNIIKIDNGKEIKIEAKSIEPVSEF